MGWRGLNTLTPGACVSRIFWGRGGLKLFLKSRGDCIVHSATIGFYTLVACSNEKHASARGFGMCTQFFFINCTIYSTLWDLAEKCKSNHSYKNVSTTM